MPQIKLSKYGKGMNSKYPERRYMYLYIEPFDNNDMEAGINKAINILNSLLAAWSPPAQYRFLRPDMWWEHVSCSYCRNRVAYENEKWINGEYFWRRGLCIRHWFVYHLSLIIPDEPHDLISNRLLGVAANVNRIIFNTETINYKYNIEIDREKANMTVDYKGKTYRFTYRNHISGHPYISSYINIVFDMYVVMDVFRTFLTEYVLKHNLLSNLVINDTITLPPADLTST